MVCSFKAFHSSAQIQAKSECYENLNLDWSIEQASVELVSPPW
jgi:hypothetical protein